MRRPRLVSLEGRFSPGQWPSPVARTPLKDPQEGEENPISPLFVTRATQFNGRFIVAGAQCATLDITPAGRPTTHVTDSVGDGDVLLDRL
jgi:hypothetical protein